MKIDLFSLPYVLNVCFTGSKSMLEELVETISNYDEDSNQEGNLAEKTQDEKTESGLTGRSSRSNSKVGGVGL